MYQEDVHSSFPRALVEAVKECFLACNATSAISISKDDLVNISPSEHFRHLFHCCICFEQSYVCAVGTCEHVICFLCALKFIYMYNVVVPYTCPYCMSESNFFQIGANPFYHCIKENPSFFAQQGPFKITKNELDVMLNILNSGANIKADKSVTMNEIFKVFLSRVRTNFTRVEALNTNGNSLSKEANFDTIYNTPERVVHAHGLFLVSRRNLVFEDESCLGLFKLVTSFVCWIPECQGKNRFTRLPKRFPSYQSLNRHLKTQHRLVLCDVCSNHFMNKRFITEFFTYSLQEIKLHVRNGDSTSLPRIEPHEFCHVCKSWHWNRTALVAHAKEEHFVCDVCEENDDIFANPSELLEHHRQCHYTCGEPDCSFLVFGNEIQLNLHYQTHHPGQKPPRIAPRRSRQSSMQSNTGRKKLDHAAKYSTAMEPLKQLEVTDWDGTIEIVKNPTKTSKEGNFTTDFLSAFDKVSLEDFILSVHVGDTGALDNPMKINIGNARHISSDMARVKEALSQVSRGESLDPKLLEHHLDLQLMAGLNCEFLAFKTSYQQILDDQVNQNSDPNRLLELVIEFVSRLLKFFYKINMHARSSSYDAFRVRLDLPVNQKDLTGLCEHFKVSLNGLMMLHALERVAEVTSMLMCKSAFAKIVSSVNSLMETLPTKPTLQPLTLLVKTNKQQKTKIVNELPLHALDPKNREPPSKTWDNLSPNRKQTARKGDTLQDRFSKGGGLKENAKKHENMKKHVPLAPGHHYANHEENEIIETENMSRPDPQDVILNRMQQHDFYGAMLDVVWCRLSENQRMHGAETSGYKLRHTVRVKLETLIMERRQNFTALSEFVPMSILEALQALEPEFYRLAKDVACASPQDIIEKWCTRALSALRRCRIEHLELVDYWLRANQGAMALRNATEFPSLAPMEIKSSSFTTRNYAKAVGGGGGGPVMFSQQDFPTLG
ncbi:bifunctional Zinc finger [Babesia duncani]|uniref:Bifunctional Zinc finger n=1 Tax=Babesia duncani TaxID=323732 RepID=A0AAD9UPG3_9APIC|nr:bifunctional Zinc finger [Babesia duncani]